MVSSDASLPFLQCSPFSGEKLVHLRGDFSALRINSHSCQQKYVEVAFPMGRMGDVKNWRIAMISKELENQHSKFQESIAKKWASSQFK